MIKAISILLLADGVQELGHRKVANKVCGLELLWSRASATVCIHGVEDTVANLQHAKSDLVD